MFFIDAPHGTKLASTFHLPQGPGRCPALLLIHGIRGARAENHRLFVLLSRRLAEAGIASLRFDHGDAGDSYRKEDEFVVRFDYRYDDAVAALSWLREHPEIDQQRVAVLGLSSGGLTVSQLVKLRRDDVSAACLWSTQAHAEPNEWKLPMYGEYLDFEGFVFSKEQCRLMREVDAVANFQGYGKPTLVLSGDQDRELGSEAFRALPEETLTYYEVRGGDHVYRTWGRTLEAVDVTVEFLKRALVR